MHLIREIPLADPKRGLTVDTFAHIHDEVITLFQEQ